MTTLSSLLTVPQTRFLGAGNLANISAAKAVVLGLPYEMGTNKFHPGAAGGPKAIRKQSLRLDRYFPQFSDIDAIAELGLVDCGDVDVTLGDFAKSANGIELATGMLAREGYRVLSFGGDGSVTLPQLRGWGPITSDLIVLHFDAHTDAYPIPESGSGPDIYTTATTFTYAAREGVIKPAQCMHIGMRGTVSVENVAGFGRDLGFQIVDNNELRADGIQATMDRVCEFAGKSPVYVCWDMDFFDPVAAPGVCDPTWGGVSAAEGLAILKALSGLDIVAMDINTVVPNSDPAGLTAHLAATVGLAGLNLFRSAAIG